MTLSHIARYLEPCFHHHPAPFFHQSFLPRLGTSRRLGEPPDPRNTSTGRASKKRVFSAEAEALREMPFMGFHKALIIRIIRPKP